MDKHLKKLEETVEKSLTNTMDEFDRLDPRRFKRSVQIGEFEIPVRALEKVKLKKSHRVTKFSRKR